MRKLNSRVLELQKARSERLSSIADLYLSGHSFRAIAELFGVGLATVHRDIQHLQQSWRSRWEGRIDQMLFQELARIDRLESEAWRSLRRSQQRQTDRAQEVTTDPDGGVTTKSRKTTRRLIGPDSQYMQIILHCVAARTKIGEMLRPTDTDPNDNVALPVEIVVSSREEAQQILTYEQFQDRVADEKSK